MMFEYDLYWEFHGTTHPEGDRYGSVKGLLIYHYCADVSTGILIS